jgi:hypothetical protein
MASQATPAERPAASPPHIGGGTDGTLAGAILMAKAHTLVDNFNDNAQNTTLWQNTASAQLREVNGRVEIRPLGNQATPVYLTYASFTTYDLTSSEVRVEVVRPLVAHANAATYLAAIAGSDSVAIGISNGRVGASYTLSGTHTVVGEAPYDETRHRWVRLREQGGTLYWETSPQGTEWTVLASRTPPITLTAVWLSFGAGTSAPLAAPGVAVFDNFNVQNTTLSRRVEERRLSARDVRVQAAEVAAARRHDEHANNNDEANYPDQPLIGNYSKGLRHDNLGDPEPGSYSTLLRALHSEDPADFEEITLGVLPVDAKRLKLTNPQSGLTFDIAGPDAQERTLPPAPRFDSQVTAHEMGELYWMAVARDVSFTDYGSSAIISAAVTSLNNEFPRFGGTVPVSVQNVFRGVYPGEQTGPYVSQFLVRGNVDPRRQAGEGRNAVDGFISYGSRTIDQRQVTAEPAIDWLQDFGSWLNSQNGVDTRGMDIFDPTRRFIRNLRDGATFVHFDQVVDAFWNAAWILMSEPMGNQQTPQLLPSGMLARPQIDLEFEKDQGNPYDPPGTAMDAMKQSGFATFGPPHLLQALVEVLGRALRAVWWQKWGVHRRLRPEEFGGRIDNWLQGRRDYPIHVSIKNSLLSGGLAPYYGDEGDRFAISYLLPQAYPEGAPTHPAYGAGHATGAGACATILKAFFDESKTFEAPLQANALGTALIAYTAPPGEPAMTVGGELNKLAGNIALFRDAAGVHWRSDYTESLPLGEAIAIGLLQEMSLGFNEDDAFFELTRFDGQKIRIFDGKVVPATA